MLFSTFTFLFLFLPLTSALCFLPPLLAGRRCLRWQNGVLLVASLLFYGWGEPRYIPLMLVTVAAAYLFAARIPRSRHPKAWLAAAVVFHLSLLFFFKYATFFARLIRLGFHAPPLPLGISFYTFQSLSYVIDIYRGEVRSARNVFTFAAYVALFPQLIAGPIVRYADVERELSDRTPNVTDAAAGARRFLAGLSKKVLLANPAGALFRTFVASADLTAVGALLALLGFSFQLYFDFSGYSDMAVGLGRVFGFTFPENFNYPYTAVSFTDFWRRWHITLSSFFRSYVYIPLGGNRKGRARTVWNLFVVWALTGLWHGAGWNFLLWGVYYFALLTLEKFILRKNADRPPSFLYRAFSLVGIFAGWMIFAFDGSAPYLTGHALAAFTTALIGLRGFSRGADLYDLIRHLPFLTLCAWGATPRPRQLFRRVTERWRSLSLLLPLAAFALCVCALADAGYNPFLYFRF